jgi:hypothetical protein
MSFVNRTLANVFATAAMFSSLTACEGPSDALEADFNEAADDSASAAQWTDPQPQPPPAPSCDALPASTKCSDPLAPGDERVCRVGNRQYTIRAGKTYDPCKPAAIVLDVPTAGESPAVHLGRETFCLGSLCWTGIGSGWAAESDTPGGGFIVVVPHGTPARGEAEAVALRDIVNETKRIAKIDPARVYVSGLGNGAESVYEAACRHGNFFRGASPNAGGLNCSAIGKGVPTIGFGAKADRNYPAIYASIENLAKVSGCKKGPQEWRKFDGSSRDAVCRSDRNDPRAQLVPCNTVTSSKLSPTQCKFWSECKDGAEVVWCDVAPGTDHGGMGAAADAFIVYHNNTNLNTPSVAWRFFQQFTSGL